MHRYAKMYKDGHTNLQIGNNTNVVDWVYVGNVAKAHLLAADKLDSDAVAGQTFFITNGQPILAWDFARAIFRDLGDDGRKKIIKIPKTIGMTLAYVAEFWAWLTGCPTEFNRFAVRYATAIQWYDIEKVRSILVPWISFLYLTIVTRLVRFLDTNLKSVWKKAFRKWFR